MPCTISPRDPLHLLLRFFYAALPVASETAALTLAKPNKEQIRSHPFLDSGFEHVEGKGDMGLGLEEGSRAIFSNG